MRFPRASIATLLATLVLTQSAHAEELAGAYAVQFTPDEVAADAGVEAFKDSMLFHGGLLSADAIAMYGFPPTAYTLEGSGFSATLTSDAAGSMKFVGKKTTEGVEGTLTWTKSDGRVVTYTFKGKAAD